jgi:AcrR family transcriptional regulator
MASHMAVGRPARLSRDALVDAAEAIVSSEGIDALTMRRLAEELGSSPMSLYRHVRDKDELLLLLIERRAAELELPALPDDPRERLVTLFVLLFDALSRNPWIVEVLAKGDLVAPSVLPVIDRILEAFVAAGLTPGEAGRAYHVAWRYTVGELTVRHSTARHFAQLDRPPRLAQIVAAVDPADMPALASLQAELAAGRRDLRYEDGIGAVVDGLLLPLRTRTQKEGNP